MTSADALAMLPWTAARAALATKTLRIRLLAPPYPALGLGTLRCLRVRGTESGLEMTIGYDGYARRDGSR